MKFPSTERLVRAFKRGWATTADIRSWGNPKSPHVDENTRNDDVLIYGGIAQVIREIQDFQIPPVGNGEASELEIMGVNARGKPVRIKVMVFDGRMSVLETIQAPLKVSAYTGQEVVEDVARGVDINAKFQSMLSNLDVPENRFGNICNCRIEMASFRVAGDKCPHCGKTVPVHT